MLLPDIETLQQSLTDLKADLVDLDRLAVSGLERLREFRVQAVQHSDFFLEGTLELVLASLEKPMTAYEQIHTGLAQTIAESVGWTTLDDCLEVVDLKKRTHDELRILQTLAAGLITSLDWQAPSYEHAVSSQAGRQTERIIGTVNDYKRDGHLDARVYENAFKSAYIEAPFYLPVRAYVTSSGMAAFSTILFALQTLIDPNDRLLAGVASYFENKCVLKTVFGERMRWVDEMSVADVLAAVIHEQPRCIFLDTLCNATSVAMPDLARLIPELARIVTDTTYLILDNTTLSLTFQPVHYLPARSKLRLIVVESLNKYHQFGFDRVTGGMIWTTGLWSDRMFNSRMHSGSIMPDVSVLALPQPDSDMLKRRLQRLERNTTWLATALEQQIKLHKSPILEAVIYPGLSSYPGYSWTESAPFHGSYFVLRFKPNQADVQYYELFLKKVLNIAKKRKIDVIAGSSFGFNVTRVYLTARNAEDNAVPFVRVSVGTESLWELERLKEVFIEAMKGFG